MCLRGQRNFLPVVVTVFVTSFFWILTWNLSSFNIYESRHKASSTTTSLTRPSWRRQSSNYAQEYYRRPVFETDKELLRHAFHEALEAPGPGPHRIAFLFHVKGPIPLEPVWRRFFQDHESEALWSLYVHTSDPSYKFPPGSLFEGTEIPSKPVQRISITLVDAIRRLLAYALSDPRYHNAWFVNVCESSIPIRGFPAVYRYLMESKHSFVESFLPDAKYQQWETTPEFPMRELRKGETWMQMTRKHAVVVVADRVIYDKFAASCDFWCAPDEEYFQTLLHLEVAAGIANRTTMFADWKEPRPVPGSPRLFGPGDVSAWLFEEIRKKTREFDGLKQDSSLDRSESGMTPDCEYNGNPNAECFLFARKFDALSASAILDVITSLGPGF